MGLNRKTIFRYTYFISYILGRNRNIVVNYYMTELIFVANL